MQQSPGSNTLPINLNVNEAAKPQQKLLLICKHAHLAASAPPGILSVRTEVATRSLSDGDRLPTIRKLTEQLNINPNTVAKVYRELELSGVIISQRGNGSFIRLGVDREAGLSAVENSKAEGALRANEVLNKNAE